ncbi:MAG: hypothetical protein LBC40_05725 [Dysgonamonadaceae bacterium]|jgi:hypothetical protein|nr:hypothetical protein [Dysgonamonadaceae bacterium]
METKMNVQEKRFCLKELSKGLRILKKNGAINSINEGLRSIYARQGHVELKSIEQWNKEGKRVNKGETALLLWERPQKYACRPSCQNKRMGGSETGKLDGLIFFPLRYVFSNLQVKEVR